MRRRLAEAREALEEREALGRAELVSVGIRGRLGAAVTAGEVAGPGDLPVHPLRRRGEDRSRDHPSVPDSSSRFPIST